MVLFCTEESIEIPREVKNTCPDTYSFTSNGGKLEPVILAKTRIKFPPQCFLQILAQFTQDFHEEDKDDRKWKQDR